MTEKVNALLVFCEGDHDVTYVRKVLKCLMGYKDVKKKFADLPHPFNNLLTQTVKNHIQGDLSLDMAHTFFLPSAILSKDRQLILLFNTGGKNKYREIHKLILDYHPLLNEPYLQNRANEVVEKHGYLFLYDADDNGLNKVMEYVREKFSTIYDWDINNEPIADSNLIFMSDADWIDSLDSPFGKYVENKAVFVWGANPESGTLEDILMPMFTTEHAAKMQTITKALDDCFSWNTRSEKTEEAIPETARKHKATLTMLGQREKPGSGLSLILKQSKLLSSTMLENNPTTQQFVQFVTGFLSRL